MVAGASGTAASPKLPSTLIAASAFTPAWASAVGSGISIGLVVVVVMVEVMVLVRVESIVKVLVGSGTEAAVSALKLELTSAPRVGLTLESSSDKGPSRSDDGSPEAMALFAE